MKPKKIKLPVVHSLAEFSLLASKDPNVYEWLRRSAQNLGWDEKDARGPAYWLRLNAAETTTEGFDGEKGVVRECNGIRRIVEDDLNKKSA